ncbi:unnamed protein product [Didymodactylos carnosus]|uniref:Uncharacterized protein n=1 Tax=Didymodactylos carnosus TaxID=1234261 RepID=A0A8S2EVG5_9BILA|nr:unnamed protein product [Didymodactylos carnosus]CAF4133050.1 unnamed protein product [Didymodactylos carnosus]
MSVNPYDILRPPDDFEMDEMDDITSSPTEARKARLPKRNSPPHPSLRPQINNDSHRRTQSTRNIEKQSNGNNTRQVQKINKESIDLILPKNFIREISSQKSPEIFQNVDPEFLIDIKKLQFLSEHLELQVDLWGGFARAASPLEDPDECIDGDDAVMRNNNDGRLIIDHSLGKFPVIVNEVYAVLKRENIPVGVENIVAKNHYFTRLKLQADHHFHAARRKLKDMLGILCLPEDQQLEAAESINQYIQESVEPFIRTQRAIRKLNT